MHRNTIRAKVLAVLYFTGYYVTYCLRSPQLARGTEQTAQCQFTRPFSRVAIGKGSGYARLPTKLYIAHYKVCAFLREQNTSNGQLQFIATKSMNFHYIASHQNSLCYQPHFH